MRSSSETQRFVSGPEDATASPPFVADPLHPGDARFESAGGGAPAPAPAPAGPDLEAMRREAFEAGREAGRAERPPGEAEARAAATRLLEAAARELAESRVEYLRAQRGALVELAVAIAERILDREVSTDPAALVASVEAALDAVPDEEPAVVHLAPADHASLCAGEGEAPAVLARHGVEVAADAALAPGDVRVRAGAARVDARRERLLERIREALLPSTFAPVDVEEPG